MSECECEHEPPQLTSIAGGSDWPAGVPEELRNFLNEALEECERVIIIGVRKTRGKGGDDLRAETEQRLGRGGEET